MNPEWNTPPNGDFARYVERLTAQMALPRQEAPAHHMIDEGAEAAQLNGQPASRPATARLAAAAGAQPPVAIAPKLVRNMLVGAVVLLVVLRLVFGISGFVLALIAVVVGWIAFMLRGVFSGQGAAALREQLERAARQAGRRS